MIKMGSVLISWDGLQESQKRRESSDDSDVPLAKCETLSISLSRIGHLLEGLRGRTCYDGIAESDHLASPEPLNATIHHRPS